MDILLLRPVDVFGPRHLTDEKDGQSLIRLERKEIESLPVQTVNELLEYSMSIDVRQRGPMDVQADLSLRGSTFDQVLVMLNGHPLNDPQTGHHNMNLPVSLQQIEAVEILYGGASVRYGPYAFAGAVNFITKQSIGASPAYAEIQGGSFGFRMLRLGAGVSGSHDGLQVNMQYSASDGYMPNTDFLQYNLHLQSDHFTKHLGMHHIRLEAGINGKYFGAQQFYSTNFPDQYEATRTAFAGLQIKSPIDAPIHYSGRFFARRHFDRFELFRETGGPYEFVDGLFINGQDTVPSWYGDHNFHRTDVLGGDLLGAMDYCLGRSEVGLDLRYESIVSNTLGEELDEAIGVVGHERGQYTRGDERRNLGLFGRHEWNFEELYFVEVGLRYNHNSAFGDDWLPSAHFRMPFEKADRKWNVHFGWNRAFRLPTYTDLYYNLGGAIGSQNLNPEYSSNYEIGLKGMQTQKGEELGLNLFRREGQQLIDWVILPDDPTQNLRAANITELNLNGLEAYYRLQNRSSKKVGPINWLQYGGEFTAMFAEDRPQAFESLYALDYLRFKAGFHGQWQLPASFRMSIRYSWQDRIGEYKEAATNELRPFDDVHLIDLRLEWRSKRQWRAYLDLNNLLGKQYVDRASVIQPGLWVRIGFCFQP